MKKYIVVIFLISLSLISFCHNKQLVHLINNVSADSLKVYDYKLASNDFGGRLEFTKGDVLTSEFISGCFKNYGLIASPTFNNSYYQKFPMFVKDPNLDPLLIEYKKPFQIHNSASKDQMAKSNESMLYAQNIIGVLQGTKPELNYIVVTAHHDHIGQIDGEIYYGADDNGSGSAGLLEIARVMGAAFKNGIRSKRTIVFISTDSEEEGMVGSDFYVNNPIKTTKNILCNVNIDMIGRVDSLHSQTQKSDGNYIYCIYKDTTNKIFNKHKLENVNSLYTNLHLDNLYEKESLSLNKYSLIYRSDHYPFMKKNIPIIWFFSGLHKDYHQTTDTPDKICYPVLKRRVQLAMAMIWSLANK